MLSTGSSAMSMAQSQQSDMQAQQNSAMNIWGERQKGQKERIKTLQGLRDAVAKIDSDIHKSRSKTATTVNRQCQSMLTQVR